MIAFFIITIISCIALGYLIGHASGYASGRFDESNLNSKEETAFWEACKKTYRGNKKYFDDEQTQKK
jgi:hypothetical protein